MILLRSHILGFGKLRSRSLEFQDGLNVIFAPNEGGKSTLQRSLLALMYGQLRSDLKVQRRLDPWVEQYKPWHGREYGGILWCRLADGRELEIHRSFGKDETKIEIRTSLGEDVTRDYEQQRNGEVLFARSHFGIPKELFESIGIIRENKVAELHGYETIRDRIANLAQSGDEELSIRQSLARIQNSLDGIGSERAPTKPYKQTLDLIQNLQAEKRALEERKSQFQSWVEDRNRIAGEISEYERELLKAQAMLLSARRRELAGKIESLEEIETELSAIRTAIANLHARADFPSARLEELNELVGGRDSIGKHLAEIRAEKDAALSRLAAAESKRRELAAYEAFLEGNEAEKITEWFVSYLSMSLQKDGLLKTLKRLDNESAVIEKRLSELSSAFSDPQNDWERTAREAAEEEQSGYQNCASLSERIAAEKSGQTAIVRKGFSQKILAGVFLGLSAVFPALRYAGMHQLPLWVDITSFAGFIALGIVLIFMASKSTRAARRQKEQLNALDLELKSAREAGGKKRRALNEAIAGSGFRNLEEFLAAAKGSEMDRRKLADIRVQSVEAENQRERLIIQSDEIYQLLKEGLAKAGLTCSTGNLKFQIDLLRTNLRQFRELDAAYSSARQNADSLTSKEADLGGEYERKCSRIGVLLEEARVASPEQFRDECLRKQKLLELMEKEASRTREFSRVAGDLTLAQWKEQLQELLAVPDPEIPGKDEDIRPSDSPALFLPYLPTIAEAEEQEKQIRSRLAAVREAYAGSVERVKQAFENFRPAYEIDEDLAFAERSFAALDRNRIALEIAFETLEKLSRQQQEVLAPQLNAAVEQRFLRLCASHYEEVKIDPDFQVWVRETSSGELRSAEHLSRGTQDQLYFSMRFGILDLVSNPDEPCPCLLDEPFAAYDQSRLRDALGVLAAEAERRQVLLFTCRDDILELAGNYRANTILLTQQLESADFAGQIPEMQSEGGVECLN